MVSSSGQAPLSRQVLDALPAEPDAIAAVSAQIAALALERASSQHQRETESLQTALSEREAQASELQTRCDELLSDHVTLTEDLASAHDSIARLEGEKAALAASVRTLAERIQKLEAFKRTLISSLQDDTPGISSGGSSLWGEAPKTAPPPEGERLVQEILANAKPAALPQRPQLLHGDSASKQHRAPYKNGTTHNSYAGGSANGLRPSSASGRERGVSPATSHAALTNPHPLNSAHIMHDKPPASQLPAAQLNNTHKSDHGGHFVSNENSMASVNAAGDHSGSLPAFGGDTPVPGEGDGHPQRVDGKEFFRQARTRLPYEAFAAFLQNIKDLNTGKQSREQTLERACSIFGDSNNDLYLSFKALLARHLS